jgi:hypothetical protein
MEECCVDPMNEEDVVVMDTIRREVYRDVEELIREMDGRVKVVQWWEILGLGNDMTHDMIRRKGVVGKDGAHLSDNTNRIAAASICIRLSGRRAESQFWGGGAVKSGEE